MRSTQGTLFSNANKSLEHGGDVAKGKRKSARPLCTKRPLHLVLRSERAKGELHLHRPQNARRVAEILDRVSTETGVKILSHRNVGNHLHIAILGKSRPLLKAFLRLLPQRLSLALTGARKGNPQGAFFDALIFTRVVGWGKPYDKLREYFFKNALEILGYTSEEVAHLRKEAARHTPPEMNGRF